MKKIILFILVLGIISGCRTTKNFWQTDNSYEGIYSAGVKEMNDKKYNEALRHFQSIAEEGKNDPILHLVIALCNTYINSYTDAIDHFVRASELKNHQSIWGNLGNVYVEVGLDSLAFDCYEKALDIDWQYAHALQNKASLISQYVDRDNETEVLYTEAILNNEALPDPWYNLGTIYEDREQYEEALDYYNQAILRVPDFYKAIVAKSFLLKKMGQPIPSDDLEKILMFYKGKDDKSLTLNDAMYKYDINRLLGNKKEEKKYYTVVFTKLNKLIEKYPLAYQFYNRRGNLQEEQLNIDAAIADYKRALEINPLSAQATNRLKRILNTNIKK